MNGRKDEVILEIEGAMGLSFPEEQIDIITHIGSPANIISCAGSGKTTLMIARLLYMQKKFGINPGEIIVISFSRSAIDDIQTRYSKYCEKIGLSNKVTFKTFHALYLMVLKYYEKTITGGGKLNLITEGTAGSLFNKAFYEKSSNKDDETKDNIKSIRSYALNNLIKTRNELINSPKFISADVTVDDYFNVITEYKELKKIDNAVDFEDLQLEMLKLLQTGIKEKESIGYKIKDNISHIYREAKEKHYNGEMTTTEFEIYKQSALGDKIREYVQSAWSYWVIDEYQDISKIQIEILLLSVKNKDNITAVGDEDQAVYEFRGGKVDYILDFPIYFNGAQRYLMGINYRCPNVILTPFERLISCNVKRVSKQMKSFNNGGEVVVKASSSCSNASMEIAEKIHDNYMNNVDLSEIAVLYRNTKEQLYIVDQLIERGIPVKVMKQSNLLHNHPIVRDIRQIVDLALDETDSYSFSKVFTKITKFISKTLVNQTTKSMINTGRSWRELINVNNNDSVDNASYSLEIIKSMIENKRNVGEILNEILKIYGGYLDFLGSTEGKTPEEIEDVINYLREIGMAKTYKQFTYYLDRAKSMIDMYSKDSDAVTVTTMHTVKGLEYSYVYILEASDSIIPSYKREEKIRQLFGESEATNYIEQERRLFYVAGTRAKTRLFITFPTSSPSRFLREMLKDTGHDIYSIKAGEEIVIK